MLVVECGPENAPERRYAIDVILEKFLGLDYQVAERPGNDFVIRRSGDDDGRRLVVSDVLFRTAETIVDAAAPPRDPLQWCGRMQFPGAKILGDLPILYGMQLTKGSFVTVQSDEIQLGLDVFGGSFVMLSRLKETLDGTRDAHGRFPASASLAHRNGFIGRPIVNEYVEVLWWALEQLWPGLERRPRHFRLLPTHDVDWPFYSRGVLAESLRAATSDVIRRRNHALAAARLRSCASSDAMDETRIRATRSISSCARARLVACGARSTS